MNLVELVWGTAAYLLSSLSLGLASWALAEAALPRPARLGLRLAAILAGQLALCGILVQTLGLFGVLTAPWYLAGSLAPGLAVLWIWRRRRPHIAFFRLLERAFRLWMREPAWGLGWLGALFLVFLATRFFFLPRDIDALTLHGPMIAEWIQSGRVSLGSVWNYPQVWEYQFVPSYLLLRSDVLVAIPGLLGVAALALAVRELAARLGLGGRIGHLLALLAAVLPIVWRETLKNDPVFAFALLLGMLAADRAARRRRGSFWLLQLAVFLVLGTKASGFLYAGVLVAAYLAAVFLTERGQRPSARMLVRGLGVTLLFQGSAGAVQLWNFYSHGNPVYPLRFALLGREIFAGPGDLSGTSILENAGQLETWRQLLVGGRLMVGEEWPALPLLLAAALLAAGGFALRRLAARRKTNARETLGLLLPAIALLLWILFLATPWSSGRSPGTFEYLGSGSSLRYAIAPLALTYLAAAALAQRFLRRRTLLGLLLVAFPLLVYGKWSHLGAFGEPRFFAGALLTVLALAGLDRGLRRWRGAAAAGPQIRMAAAGVLALLLLVVFARSVEASRERRWVKPYRAIWTEVYDRLPPASKIGINDARASYRYFLYGRGFRNALVPVDLEPGGLEPVTEAPLPGDLAYFYVFAARGAGRQPLIDAMSRRGWQVLALSEDGRGALLARP